MRCKVSVSETFDRKFNKSMRGYNTEEVDAALDALLRYCDELEDANREFEIANNDLIDDKTSLNNYISELLTEKEELQRKLKEISERVASVEGLYNGYREKFGEARDMITKAKSSSSEIIARAEARAEIITEEARRKQEDEKRKFDIEIEKRRALIEKLDICYNEFCDNIKEKLGAMLDRVDSFAASPALPHDLPKMRPIIDNVDTEIAELDAFFEEAQPQTPTEPILPTDVEEDEVEIVEEPQMTPYDLDSSDEDSTDDDVIFYESNKPVIGSKMSQMKSSLDEINQKVIKKKTTPHI